MRGATSWKLWDPTLGDFCEKSAFFSINYLFYTYMGVSKNNGTPKSSTFIGIFHYFHHPFWGIYPNFWKHPYGQLMWAMQTDPIEGEKQQGNTHIDSLPQLSCNFFQVAIPRHEWCNWLAGEWPIGPSFGWLVMTWLSGFFWGSFWRVAGDNMSFGSNLNTMSFDTVSVIWYILDCEAKNFLVQSCKNQ